ncbi:MAG: ligase-associated DNA damage response endonuclease PdeM [Saprospiraceae bacterium]|nr:ligase-associated DNA damage response endonuclease PdeM [Saprospiraceae bacterium]
MRKRSEDPATMDTIEVSVQGQHLVLHAGRVLFWIEHRALILSDLHLGKAQHFRRHGIPVPANILEGELHRLGRYVDHFAPDHVWILGDLSHSVYNRSWEEAIRFFGKYPEGFWRLVPGNHDMMEQEHYQRAGISIASRETEVGPFLLTHQYLQDPPSGTYQLTGHIHPGVRLHGKGAQALTLPCFCFGGSAGILPAFGRFTGLGRIALRPHDRVFAIADDRIFELNGQSVSLR